MIWFSNHNLFEVRCRCGQIAASCTDQNNQSTYNLRVDLGADSGATTIRKRHHDDQRHHNPGPPVTVGYRMFRPRGPYPVNLAYTVS